MFCSNCGNKIPENNTFCANCKQISQFATVNHAHNTTTNTNKKKNFIVVTAIIAAVVVLLFYSSNRNPYGLNGRWEAERPDSRYTSTYLDFSGNRFTYITYRNFWTDRQITVDDLTTGSFHVVFNSLFGGLSRSEWRVSHPSHVHEILNQRFELTFVTPDNAYDTYMSLLRTSVSGTFTIGADGRIELVWPDDNGIQVSTFSQTENTITIDGRQYIRR